jgi:hypothetical protein
VFPDFASPSGTQLWQKFVSEFIQGVGLDGICRYNFTSQYVC